MYKEKMYYKFFWKYSYVWEQHVLIKVAQNNIFGTNWYWICEADTNINLW